MAPGTPERRKVKHYKHKHPLTEVNGFGQFTCDGCNLYGFGKTYRCFDCDFDLHEFCATCPSTLRASVHPPHELIRIDRPTRPNQRVCNVCNVYVQGLFYRCESCDFDAHPLCTLHHHPPPQPPPSPIAASPGTRQRSLVTPEGQPSSPHYSAPGSPFGHGGHHHYVNSGSGPGPGPGPGQGKNKSKGFLKTAGNLTATLFTQVVAGVITGELAGTSEE